MHLAYSLCSTCLFYMFTSFNGLADLKNNLYFNFKQSKLATSKSLLQKLFNKKVVTSHVKSCNVQD